MKLNQRTRARPPLLCLQEHTHYLLRLICCCAVHLQRSST